MSSDNVKTKSCHFCSQPVYRLLLLSLILVSLIPVLFLMMHLYQAAWNNAWREINEKHRLLALNLANPIKIYIDDRRSMLGKLAQDIANDHSGTLAVQKEKLEDAILFMDGFKSIALVSKTGKTLILAHNNDVLGRHDHRYRNEKCFLHSRDTHIWCLSDIKIGPTGKRPTIIMTQAIPTEGNRPTNVLLAELGIDTINNLRKNIKFGKRGHSAIVDKRGHVIAHPNPEWMKTMHDLSKLSIVQKMMHGETGVAEFFSPYIKADMVAGYTSVPEIGWGIMVPQPLQEIKDQVNKLMLSHTRWLFIGISLALLIGIFLVHWITRPLNRLAAATDDLLRSNFATELPTLSAYAPREIHKLYAAMSALINGFRKSQQENEKLNATLQQRVDDATVKLIDSNARLERLALCDHLTTLPNRRQFESVLRNKQNRRQTDSKEICLMLIDIDHFKDVNDCYGHAAGDLVIRDIALILNKAMRLGDLVARYGGDEFAAQLLCNEATCHARAEQIRQEIENTLFDWNDNHISATVSIGMIYCGELKDENIDMLLHEVDTAMYQAKKQGRNQVHTIQLKGKGVGGT